MAQTGMNISFKGGIIMNITIVGPRGAMGRALIQEIAKNEDFSLFSAIGRESAPYIGEDAGIVAGAGKFMGVAITSDIATAIRGSQMIVDFSVPEASEQVLAHAVQRKVPLVCGTTGFSRGQYGLFQEASGEIPIVVASNTSRVVYLMRRLLAEAAHVLQEAEIEVIDMHARSKKDAPSGTALEFLQTMGAVRNLDLKEEVAFGRKGQQTASQKEIGVHSIRSGDVPSSHTVWFGLPGERLEITHHATGMKSFALGALEAARFLYDCEPGLYTMEEVFSVR